MCSFADLNKTLPWRVGQLSEKGVCHVARQIRIPFGMNQQSRHSDPAWIVESLTGPPGVAIQDYTVRGAQHGGRLPSTDRIGGPGRFSPLPEPTSRNELGLFVVGYPIQPTLLSTVDRYR